MSRKRSAEQPVSCRRSKLSGKDLTGQDFTDQILERSDFSGSKLNNAIFVGADLTDCHFDGASLEGADFSYAYMAMSVLNAANLKDANLDTSFLVDTSFTDCNLTGTCLDPNNAPNQEGAELFKSAGKAPDGHDILLGYRTSVNLHTGEFTYCDGAVVKADVFSTATSRLDHPGIYVYTSAREVRAAFPTRTVMQVRFKKSFLHGVRGAYRVKKLIVDHEVRRKDI